MADVFISYSYKDYVDDTGRLILGNKVSNILDALSRAKINYWYDKDGIEFEDNFPERILDNIKSSSVFVYLSTEHANASRFISKEIACADDYGKHIIPVKIDNSPYNSRVMFRICDLNYIDYKSDSEKGQRDLIDAIRSVLEEGKKEAARKEIEELASTLRGHLIQQDTLLRQLYAKNRLVGRNMKQCPVCMNEEPIDNQYCRLCGWQFPMLYGLDGTNTLNGDVSPQIAMARANWNYIASAARLKEENSVIQLGKREIEDKRSQLEESIRKKIEGRKRKVEEERRFKSNHVFRVGSVEFKMVFVEGGTFKMGEHHDVTLSDYCIGETQVTQALWKAVRGHNSSYFKNDFQNTGNYPVEDESWNTCQIFIEELNEILEGKLQGRKFRLPTEAEWEFAARGGNKSYGYEYSGGNDIDKVGWYRYNSGRRTHPVAQKQPNELGIYDMSGNVWEWCHDWYGDYSNSPQTNPQGSLKGSYRVQRGGDWYSDGDYCRVAKRFHSTPNYHSWQTGFRLAL